MFIKLKPSKQKAFIFSLLAFLCLASPAFAEQAETLPDLRVSPSGHPAAETLFVPSLDELPAAAPPAAWYEKPGARKGLSGRAELDEEFFAAPDIAVLDRGFSRAWPAIFAEFQEPVVRVQPREVAGLSATKQLLIIPSGALANTAESAFFKAALAEYVRAGGIIFCLSQTRGTDYKVLPVPEGQRLDAAGWSEDSGPLFRVSAIQTAHPLVANMAGPLPALETDGYITAHPAGSQILLQRPDGFPTAIVFPYEKGWVVVTALFTDFSSLLGTVDSDEKKVIRQLLAWTRQPEHGPAPAAAGTMPTAKPAAAPVVKTGNQKSPSAAPPRVTEQVEKKGDRISLTIEIPPLPRLAGETVLARAGGREKSVALGKDKTVISLDLPAPVDSPRRLSYALYQANGRAIVRSSFAVSPAGGRNVAPARLSYFPGDTVQINVNGMGKGEITCGGLGYLDNEIIPDHGSMNLQAVTGLPAGSYRIEWNYEEIRGAKKRGDFSIDLKGYTVDIRSARLQKPASGKNKAAVSLDLASSSRVSGRLRLVLISPDGRSIDAAEPVLSLVEGVQTVPVTFPFAQDTGGIWELRYSFTTILPSGSGIPQDPVELAAGGIVFDAGEAAVLAVSTDKPLYYDAAGPVELIAAVSGRSKTTIEVDLDGRQVSRENAAGEGVLHYRVALPKLEAGIHTVRVSAGSNSSASHTFTYGLNLPDIAVSLQAGSPRTDAGVPLIPLAIEVRNQGKNSAGQSRVAVAEEDGTLIGTIDVPALAPHEQHRATLAWPLTAKAGERTLVASADAENALTETSKLNNRASLNVAVPDILLLSRSEKTAFNADETVALDLTALNLSIRALNGLSLDMQVQNPAGRTIFTEKMAVPELAAGSERTLAKKVILSAPVSIGKYQFSGRLTNDKLLASVSGGFSINPTLLLTGSLEGTPSEAVLCKPFTAKFAVKNTGNAYPSSGTISFEIVPQTGGKAVLSKSVPFKPGIKNLVIDAPDLPSGAYKLRMAASVANDQYQVTRQLALAEQPLTVAGPVIVKRVAALFPRVLVWLGRQGRVVEQAVAENIVKQAFEQEELYSRVVDSEDRFMAQANTGLFNTYVLIEPQETPDAGWLQERVQGGQGLVIIGSNPGALAVAASFGFSAEELLPKRESSMITFTSIEKLGLSGTMPVSGKTLSPRKKGAKPAALHSPSGQPAALLDLSGKGRVLVMPLSLSRSAFYGGANALYSFVLKRSVLFTAPDNDESGGPAGGELMISSPAGAVAARVIETFPQGDRVLWANAGGTIKDNTVTYTVTADREPLKLLNLRLPSLPAEGRPGAEVFFECGGNFVSQGKVE